MAKNKDFFDIDDLDNEEFDDELIKSIIKNMNENIEEINSVYDDIKDILPDEDKKAFAQYIKGNIELIESINSFNENELYQINDLIESLLDDFDNEMLIEIANNIADERGFKREGLDTASNHELNEYVNLFKESLNNCMYKISSIRKLSVNLDEDEREKIENKCNKLEREIINTLSNAKDKLTKNVKGALDKLNKIITDVNNLYKKVSGQ